jgi:hypothetical protein
VPCHADRRFRNPRHHRIVGLCTRGTASADEWRRGAALEARGAAWASRHCRPQLPRSRAAGAAAGVGSGHRLIWHSRRYTIIALAALFGVGFIATHVLKRRLVGILIGIHATLAVSGFVILAVYVLAG